MDAVMSRKSVRKFTEQAVTKEQIEQLLRAAMQAPSAHNQQPWEFVVVQRREALRELSQVHPYAGPMAGAAVGVVVVRRPGEFSPHWPQDLSAAVENLLVKAEAMGLGAVWMGLFPDRERMELVGKMLSAPEGAEVFAMVAVGVPAERREALSRYDAARVHWERY